MQASQKTLQEAITPLDRQPARLLEVYLTDTIGRDEIRAHTTERDPDSRRFDASPVPI